MSSVFRTGLPAADALTLQRCRQCEQVNYPPRELCGHCLADALQWQAVPDGGAVQSLVQLHYSLEPAYAGQLPWTVASVKLDCGPVVLAHAPPGTAIGARVKVRMVRDNSGNIMLAALDSDEESTGAAAGWLAAVDFREVRT